MLLLLLLPLLGIIFAGLRYSLTAENPQDDLQLVLILTVIAAILGLRIWLIQRKADKTLRSILISLNARLGAFGTPEICGMTMEDDIDIPSLGQKKSALFVVVSDTERSLDGLVNIFFTQAMHELCRYADKECPGGRLPVPVRFILDDFATNCRIEEFPRMIASIRSRGISAMLMVQAEAQLMQGYGEDGRTIIGNCDTYVFLGGNDLPTAENVARRADVLLSEILSMPAGMGWIFRRGMKPVRAKEFELETFKIQKMLRQGKAERTK